MQLTGNNSLCGNLCHSSQLPTIMIAHLMVLVHAPMCKESLLSAESLITAVLLPALNRYHKALPSQPVCTCSSISDTAID